jgi:flagellar biogenesis protein FliO
MSAATAELPLLARGLMALAAVLALLVAARWLLARQGFAGMSSARHAGGLRVAETLALDARNRLVVIRRGGAELVLAIGPAGVSRLDFAIPPDGSGSAGPVAGP